MSKSLQVTMQVFQQSYYKPTEREVLEDYLKVVDLLTIDVESMVLQKQVHEITEKTQNNEHIIMAKLQEKDDAVVALSDQVVKLMEEVQEFARRITYAILSSTRS